MRVFLSTCQAFLKKPYWAGRPLPEIQNALGLDLIGTNNAWAHARGKFPLLIKLLDACQPLSVQVHPGDDYALAHEVNELGKTEMWVVLDARRGAEIILGVTRGSGRENFRAAILAGRLEPRLHRVPVKPGDHICVPAGSLHAILGGILIAEIQQNSNTTYRVYDWNRTGTDGKPRPLHIERALDVTDWDQVEPALCPPELVANSNGIHREELCRNAYFVTERVSLAAGAAFRGECDGRTLEIWGLLSGAVAANKVALRPIQFTLLPAALGPYEIAATEESVLLRTFVPDPVA